MSSNENALRACDISEALQTRLCHSYFKLARVVSCGRTCRGCCQSHRQVLISNIVAAGGLHACLCGPQIIDVTMAVPSTDHLRASSGATYHTHVQLPILGCAAVRTIACSEALQHVSGPQARLVAMLSGVMLLTVARCEPSRPHVHYNSGAAEHTATRQFDPCNRPLMIYMDPKQMSSR